jgi:hypothetical protein
MPSHTQWFKVTQDINSDPEMWELREKYGDRAVFLWLEMLAIAARNRGVVGPDNEHTIKQLRVKCRLMMSTSRAALQWMTSHSWVNRGEMITIVKWSKYNRTRVDDKTLLKEKKRKEVFSSHKNAQKTNPPSAEPSVVFSNSESEKGKEKKSMGRGMGLIPELKEACDEVYYIDRKKFDGLAKWINQGRKHGYSEPDMAEALRRFKAGHYDLIDEWYPYLDTILEKVVGDRNAKESIAEHERFKQEEQDFLKNEKPVLSLVKGIADAKKV